MEERGIEEMVTDVKKSKMKVCEFTGRTNDVGFHHYYPRPYHKKHRKEGAFIYSPYHAFLHARYDNQTLATELNNYQEIMQILADEFGV